MKKTFKIFKLKMMLVSVDVRETMVYDEFISGTLTREEAMAELDDLDRIKKISQGLYL